MIHGYYACVSFVDAQINKVIITLEELGLAENTIIVIWGDHGYKIGEYGDWTKHTNFELDTKVPLIFNWKNHIPEHTNQTIAELLDIYPTLTDLAGLPKPLGIQGTSLVDLIENQKIVGEKVALSQYPRGKHMGYSIRNQQFRYTAWINEDTNNVDFDELYDHSDQGMIADKNLMSEESFRGVGERMKMQLFEKIRK